ncbi:hypothetical protein B0H14DRAFT_3869834 [Mycena olivaceomarginata]|nr:hypothetical protein B0H14DRAFT_3869834 [Mycena olivaceomarginata]
MLAADRALIAELDVLFLRAQETPIALQLQCQSAQSRLDVYIVLTLPCEITAYVFVNFLPVYPLCPPLFGLLSLTVLCHIFSSMEGYSNIHPSALESESKIMSFHEAEETIGRAPVFLETCDTFWILSAPDPTQGFSMLRPETPLVTPLVRAVFTLTAFLSAPRLTRLRLYYDTPTQIRLPWSQIAELLLGHPQGLAEAAAILNLADNLVHCSLSHCSLQKLHIKERGGLLTLDFCRETFPSIPIILLDDEFGRRHGGAEGYSEWGSWDF